MDLESLEATGIGKILRVLLVEDREDDAQLLVRELRRAGYDVIAERVQTADDMRAALQSKSWQIVLSDYSLPGFSGPAALAVLKEANLDLPFIMVSGTIGEETAVESLKAGASDFLLKDKLARLVPAVEREIREAELRRSREREREALEVQFRQLEDRATYALDAAGAGIWEVDLVSGTTQWTEGISVMFGLPAKPMQATMDEFRERLHPDDLAIIEAAIAHSIDTDAPYRAQFRAVWPDGNTRWIASKGRVLRRSTGEPIAMMGISIDVTDRKELEQQLQQAQKMESLGRLAGGIAHDFNNVLMAILGFSELLLTDLDSADPRAHDAAEIKKAAESGRQLTRQLLAFSRQQSLEPARLDLNATVAASTGILQQLLGKTVQLETALGSPIGSVWADAGQMQQILVNLAVNARDAMPQGGRLRIETYAATVDDARAARQDVTVGSYVVLAVTDTGSGMSAETQARIFEPFFTTKAPDKGTGLGLSTVYGIVRQSGGFIDLTSAVGAGTTFRIYLREVGDT